VCIQPHVAEVIDGDRGDELAGNHGGQVAGISHAGNEHDGGGDEEGAEDATDV